MLAKAAEKGFTFYLGPELTSLMTPSLPLMTRADILTPPLDRGSPMRRDTVMRLEEMGIRVEYSHHEVADSQHEIDLRYDEGLRMADKVMT